MEHISTCQTSQGGCTCCSHCVTCSCNFPRCTSLAALSTFASFLLINLFFFFRFFIGTSVSTFSFRIHEEREILGFDPKTTYNRFCGDTEKECEQPTHWKIVYWRDLCLSWHTQVPKAVLNVTFICTEYTKYFKGFMVYFSLFMVSELCNQVCSDHCDWTLRSKGHDWAAKRVTVTFNK